MTRILHISPTDIEGGACLGAYNLHKALQRAGADSRMLVLRKFTDDPTVATRSHGAFATLEALRDPLDRLPLKAYDWNGQNWWTVGWLPFDVRQAVDRLKPDVVHFHWTGRGMVPIRAVARLRRYPLLWTLRDMWPLTGGCHYSNDCTKFATGCGACPQLRSKSDSDISRWQWRAKQRRWRYVPITYIALSNWMAEQARRSPLVGDKDIVRLANGIDVERFRPTDKSAARASWRLPLDRQIILFGANFAIGDPRKGFAYFAEALRRLSAAGWNRRALAVVFGAEQGAENLGMPVRYVGHVRSNGELARLYSAADVMVAPSLYENAAKTVMESLACGTPVAAFANTGQVDLIDHKRSGYLALDRSAEDLAAGIAWCLDRQHEGDALSRGARLKATAEFDIDLIARDHLFLYERVVAARRRRSTETSSGALPVGDLLAVGAIEGGAR